jgi:hypothetical protein
MCATLFVIYLRTGATTYRGLDTSAQLQRPDPDVEVPVS